jgi:hypothetical protein
VLTNDVSNDFALLTMKKWMMKPWNLNDPAGYVCSIEWGNNWVGKVITLAITMTNYIFSR